MADSIALHTSVLLEEVIAFAKSALEWAKKPRVVVDCTLGLGGHTATLMQHLHIGDTLIGFERDPRNLILAQERLTPVVKESGVHFVPVAQSFDHIGEVLDNLGLQADCILYDVGVSSPHFDDASRGFSYKNAWPLDMRFDPTEAIPTAADMVNTKPLRELTQILRDYGEEPRAFQIANAILRVREHSPIQTTEELMACIAQASHEPKAPMRVFQALRIAVNDELNAIERSLEQALPRLTPHGRCIFIAFHSLEDRIAKECFRRHTTPEINDLTGHISKAAPYMLITRKPVVPTPQETAANPRARSSKLRVIEKLPPSPLAHPHSSPYEC